MRNAPIWLMTAALFAACNCNGDDNNVADMAGTDMAQNDDGTPNNGTDMGDSGMPDEGTPDMTVLPDGVSIPGLTGNVTASFDANGVLHVSCETSDDCFAVQGYFHAAHRFVSMDVQRRFLTGRLAGLIGNAALGIDLGSRALTSTRDGQPLEEAFWEGSSDETRQGISAYTRGVNAWLDDLEMGRNGAKLSEEYELQLIDQDAPILEWTETDSIACGLLLLESLSNRSSAEIGLGMAYPQLTPDQAFDLLGTMSATQVATMPASGETYDRVQALIQWPDADQLRPALERLRPHQDLLADAYNKMLEVDKFWGNEGLDGSNNWVLGGDVTASGMPILANDPHLGMQNPALWYMVEINASGGADELHIAGVSLPGMPGVLLGHNENISWGGTVVNMDLSDVYLEELTDDGGSVVFNGGTVEIIEIEHTFEVARGNPETHTLRFVPHHGPVLSYDPANNRAISLRWAANDARTDLDMFFGLFTATTVDEARTAIANSNSTNQNWIVADRNGDIGWFPFNAIHERPWASLALPPWLPLPGDGTAEWGERISVDDQPQMVNPTNGYIGTANTDPVGTGFDGDPTNDPYGYFYIYGEFGGFRQDAVIRRIVDGGTTHTAENSMDMQADSFLVLRDWVRPGVQAVIDNNPGTLSANASEFWSTIETWNGECPSGIDGRDPAGPKTADATVAAASIGCSAFHHLLFELTRLTFADELAPTNYDHDSSYAVRSLVVLMNDSTRLQGGDIYWDNTTTDGPPETQDMIVLEAIEAATTKIRADLGTDTDDWRWGSVHTLLLFANLFDNAGFTQYNEGPYAAPGGMHAINVANPRNPSDGNWGFSHAASMRHVSEFTADGIKSFWTLPGGQRHFRDSPFYDSLLDDWFAGNHFAMPFTPEEVTAAAMETVEVVPR